MASKTFYAYLCGKRPGQPFNIQELHSFPRANFEFYTIFYGDFSLQSLFIFPGERDILHIYG
jgi:hypothetical protein